MDKNIAYITKHGGKNISSFTKTHKDNFEGNVFFYYGGTRPNHLEHYGPLRSKKLNLLYKVKRNLNIPSAFTESEQLLINSFNRHKIDIVYVEFGTVAVEVLNVCKHLRLPMVVAFLGYDISIREVLQKYENRYKTLLAYVSAVVVVSKSMIPTLIALGGKKDKIIWTPYPPHDRFYQVQPKYNTPNFFMMGRFVDKKAPYYAILAFKKVIEKYTDCVLNIAGDGPLKETCENLARHYKIDSNIHFLGNISQAEAATYYEKSLAFIQHSITAHSGDQEGTPVSILEASLAGLPVVSTIHAGIPDVICNQETGLLVSEHNVKAMADAMTWLIEHKDKAKQMGQNGKQYIYNNFRADIHMKRLNEKFNKILNK